MKTFDTIDFRNSLYYNPATRVLAPFKFSYITFYPNKDEYILSGESDGVVVFDRMTELAGRFFKNEDDFNANKPVEDRWRIYSAKLTDMAFCFESNKDKAVRITENGLTEYDLNGAVYSITLDDYGKVIVDVPDDNVYKDEVAARKHMDYVVVDEQGKRTTHKSLARLVALTDEQRAVIKDLEGIFDKALDLGVSFIFDTKDWDGVYAFNRNELKDYENVWGEDRGDEYINDLLTPVDINMCDCGEDCRIYVTRK